jgi:FkbM family methyltransferase
MLSGRNLKRLAIRANVYGIARRVHRAITPHERRQFHGDLDLYRRFVQPGELCFDVGANVGAKTEVLLRLGAKVVSFEPQPDLAKELIARTRRFRSRSVIVEQGLSDQSGVTKLHLRRDTSRASLLRDWEGEQAGEILIQLTTLDAAISKFGFPKFCKIDVEGAEPQVIKGLSQPIPIMSIEYHADSRGTELLRESLSLLPRLGHYHVNATAEEGSQLLYLRWMKPQDFISSFPANVRPSTYGDIFVRLESIAHPQVGVRSDH